VNQFKIKVSFYMLESKPKPEQKTMFLYLTVISILTTSTIIALALFFSTHGFDFTDESFHLIWIKNPFLYKFSISQFGFFYHPIYDFFAGDIALLRQFNMLVIYVAAWCLTYHILRQTSDSTNNSQISLHSISAGIATSVFISFESWLVTPNYNSLTFTGLLLTAIGLIRSLMPSQSKSLFGLVLVGFGGWMTFMGKPTSAIGLALGTIIFFILSGKYSWKYILVAPLTAGAFLLASSYYIDGSFIDFTNRLVVSLEHLQTMGSNHDWEKVLRFDTLHLSDWLIVISLIISTLMIAAIIGVSQNTKIGRLFYTCIGSFFFIATLIILIFPFKWSFLEGLTGLLSLAIVFSCVALGILHTKTDFFKLKSIPILALTFFMLSMPHVYAFGTNSNYLFAASLGCFFWQLSAFTLLGSLAKNWGNWFFALPIVLASQAITATAVKSNLDKPYRQPHAVYDNGTLLEIGSSNSALIIPTTYANYIQQAVRTSKEGDFEIDTPMIDLSGQSPGILFALGAESIGAPWLIGGYSGSLKNAETVLGNVRCKKIAEAWVLQEPMGPRPIPNELMIMIGASFPYDYNEVGNWLTPPGTGGYAESRTQILFKPQEPNKTLKNCENLRKSSQGKSREK
jgi:hypothetical protein